MDARDKCFYLYSIAYTFNFFFVENNLMEIPFRTISTLKKLEILRVNNNLITDVRTDSFNNLKLQVIEVILFYYFGQKISFFLSLRFMKL